ncbi:MAG: class I SAM-dependent methyltransferase [Halobacteriaceae archaeon]
MSDAVRRFYGRRARTYDLLARYTPGVRRWRRAAVTALDLDPGDTVLDIGCGTGASFPYLRDAVGPAGRVVGVDVTPELLDRATRRASRWQNVTVVAGDGSTPPVCGGVDGVLGCFVVGLFEAPATVVDEWATLLGSAGRIALLDGVPAGWSTGLDRVFGYLVRVGTPPGSREAVLDRLRTRVDGAHGRVTARGTATTEQAFALGYVRLSAATLGEGGD